MEALHIFREQEIREELGLGSIRDSFSDILFPGTSTLQTRAKYMLFIPWIFLKHEERQTPSEKIASLSRRDEINLIFSLIRSGEKDGVIGYIARENLKILPSSIYWTGLGKWGIRRFDGSMDQYFRYLDSFYFYSKDKVLSDDKEPFEDMPANWDPNLVKRPANFPEGIRLSLSYKEAEYLHDRILASCPESLLAFLIDKTKPTKNVTYIWHHPDIINFPKRLRKIVRHAQNFSESMHSAALLYNLMLSEKAENQGYIDRYSEKLHKWAEGIEKRFSEIDVWELDEFWEIAKEENPRIPYATVRFVEKWIQIVREEKKIWELSDYQYARKLVYDREVKIKRNRSRLKNTQMLQHWSGASGAGALDFRWKFVERIVNDILYGLRKR